MSVSTVVPPGSARATAAPRWQIVATILVAGLPALALGRVIWPDPVGASQPPTALLPVFMGISALESLLFGAGVAFVLFGRRWLPAGGTRLATATYVAIAWSLLSWWPHDNLHRVTHDWTGLAAIEVGFHVTLIVSILVIGAYFIRSLQPSRAER
jgi:hypothetical protein